MYERLPSLTRIGMIPMVARVERREDFRWQGDGYAVFSSSGNLMGRCDELLDLERELVQLESDYCYIEGPYNFVHKGQRMRYVPLGPVSKGVLSWLLSWRYL